MCIGLLLLIITSADLVFQLFEKGMPVFLRDGRFPQLNFVKTDEIGEV